MKTLNICLGGILACLVLHLCSWPLGFGLTGIVRGPSNSEADAGNDGPLSLDCVAPLDPAARKSLFGQDAPKSARQVPRFDSRLAISGSENVHCRASRASNWKGPKKRACSSAALFRLRDGSLRGGPQRGGPRCTEMDFVSRCLLK
ncbi:hypothetical protein M885DRAFT_321808 [Pelagophyceae sp. CCMP2097]|nr:hypothetical protein M885DRAFT_321808 [Pelagophyceae sp. CCMP2097]